MLFFCALVGLYWVARSGSFFFGLGLGPPRRFFFAWWVQAALLCFLSHATGSRGPCPPLLGAAIPRVMGLSYIQKESSGFWSEVTHVL